MLANNGSGDIVIFDGLASNSNRKVISCVLLKEINKFDNLSFKLLFGHPLFNSLSEFSSKIKLWDSMHNDFAFIGRIYTINSSMDSSGLVVKEFVCESELACLCDSIQPFKAEELYEDDVVDGVVSESGLHKYLSLILDNHNSACPNCTFFIGDVDVQTNANDSNVYKGLNFSSSWDTISSKLIDVFGGEVRVRYVNGVRYLDYLEQIGVNRSTVIELGVNMISSSQEFNSNDIVSRLIPLGYKLKTLDSNGNEIDSEERLTISSVNNGVIFIQNDDLYNLYGPIYAIEEFSDVTDANNLLSKGIDALANISSNLSIKNSVSAVNMFRLGFGVDDINLGDFYPVKNVLLDIDSLMRVVKVSIDVINVQNSSFDMGDTVRSLSDDIKQLQNDIIFNADLISKTENAINSNIANAFSEFYERFSSIVQTDSGFEAIVQEQQTIINNFDTFISTVSNVLDMDSSGTSMIFQTVEERLSNLENDSSSEFNSLYSFIRFENGNIVLGEMDSPFSLVIENNKMSFRKNGVTVSFWDMDSDFFNVGNICVRLGERAQLGNFAFIPRSNGSLSFVKLND